MQEKQKEARDALIFFGGGRRIATSPYLTAFQLNKSTKTWNKSNKLRKNNCAMLVNSGVFEESFFPPDQKAI